MKKDNKRITGNMPDRRQRDNIEIKKAKAVLKLAKVQDKLKRKYGEWVKQGIRGMVLKYDKKKYLKAWNEYKLKHKIK